MQATGRECCNLLEVCFGSRLVAAVDRRGRKRWRVLPRPRLSMGVDRRGQEALESLGGRARASSALRSAAVVPVGRGGAPVRYAMHPFRSGALPPSGALLLARCARVSRESFWPRVCACCWRALSWLVWRLVWAGALRPPARHGSACGAGLRRMCARSLGKNPRGGKASRVVLRDRCPRPSRMRCAQYRRPP